MLLFTTSTFIDIHAIAQSKGIAVSGGSALGAKYIVRGRKDTTQTVLNIKRAQGFCPWSPSREGARDQSSFMRRGLPSKGEARAIHHQPAPALTLTMPCLCSLLSRPGVETLKHYLKSRGLGWRIHGSVEDTKLSTNKQHPTVD